MVIHRTIHSQNMTKHHDLIQPARSRKCISTAQQTAFILPFFPDSFLQRKDNIPFLPFLCDLEFRKMNTLGMYLLFINKSFQPCFI